MAVAHVLADQVRGLPCACVQIDEANIPGNPADGPLAARAINAVLDSIGHRHSKGRPLSALATTAAKPSSRASGAPCSTFSTNCAPIT